MAVFLPLEEEDSCMLPSLTEIQDFEELQETDFFEHISTAALMNRLHLKFSQKPWGETGKLVRACMDKPKTVSSTASKSPISRCLEKLQRAINAESLSVVMNKLEFLAKQKGLNSHASSNGTAFYITSEVFYIEIQLQVDGEATEVKLAHPGESPQICKDLLQLLRMKNYDAFGNVLEELVSIYQIPGSKEAKAKVYLALQSLEKDISSLSLFHRTPDMERISEILYGKVGYLRPRIRGTPMNLEFYLSPTQILEEQLTPGLQIPGLKVFVTIGVSDVTHKLPVFPLLGDSWTEAEGHLVFLPLAENLCMEFSACFFLKFHQPFPLSSSSIDKLQKLTGITINGLDPAPLHALIVQYTLSENQCDLTMTNNFIVSLPDCPKHTYYIGSSPEKSGLTGAMVSKLPFTHPKHVPDMIEILRHQASYNTLISSCVSGVTKCEVPSDLLHFEVSPVKVSSFSVTFQQPGEENLACVAIDVLSPKEMRCTLYALSEDRDLNYINDFLTRVLKRCMSVPILMRAIFRTILKTVVKQTADEPAQSMEEMSEKNPQEASESETSNSGEKTPQEASESETSNSSDTGFQNVMARETRSSSIVESLPGVSSQASLRDITQANSASVGPSDDSTEVNTSLSSLQLSSSEVEVLSTSVDTSSGDKVEEGSTDELQTSQDSMEGNKSEGDASEKS